MAFTVPRVALAAAGATIGVFSLFGSGTLIMAGLFSAGLLMLPAAFLQGGSPTRGLHQAFALVGGGLLGFVALWVGRPFLESDLAVARIETALLLSGGGYRSYALRDGGGTVFEPVANTIMFYTLLTLGAAMLGVAFFAASRKPLPQLDEQRSS